MTAHSKARVAALGAGLVSIIAFVSPAGAQRSPKCAPLCAPGVSIMPALLRTHLFGGPLVRPTSGGPPQRLAGSSSLEVIVAATSHTAWKPLSVYASVQWLPNALESRNPFTLYTASELGDKVHANAPTVSLGLAMTALPPAHTDGWLGVGVNIAELFSQAARPTDRSAYTGKLDLELTTHLHPFARLEPSAYLHGVTAFALLDYVATGLPRTGDEVPLGRTFVSDARPTSFITGMSFPIVPDGSE